MRYAHALGPLAELVKTFLLAEIATERRAHFPFRLASDLLGMKFAHTLVHLFAARHTYLLAEIAPARRAHIPPIESGNELLGGNSFGHSDLLLHRNDGTT